MKKKRENSIYEYHPEYSFTVEEWISDIPIDERDIYSLQTLKKKISNGTYSNIEILILKILYKYQYLNEYNIRRELHIRLPKKLHKPKFDRNLKDMCKDGTLIRYTLKKDEKNNQIIYTLSKSAHTYVKKIYKTEIQRYSTPKDYSDIDTSSILEKLSLNQWHISVREMIGKNIKEEVYYQKKKISNREVPLISMFRIKPQNKNKKNVCVLAIPIYKTEESYNNFIKRLININYLKNESRHKYSGIITVVPCESTIKMQEAYKRINKIKQLRNTNIVFTLDKTTTQNDCFEWLFMCEIESGTIKYTNCSLNI